MISEEKARILRTIVNQGGVSKATTLNDLGFARVRDVTELQDNNLITISRLAHLHPLFSDTVSITLHGQAALQLYEDENEISLDLELGDEDLDSGNAKDEGNGSKEPGPCD